MSRRPPLSLNHIALLFVAGFLWLMAGLFFLALSSGPEGRISFGIAGAAFPVLLSLVPILIVRRSRRGSSRSHSMSGIVRSSRATGRGFVDVEITTDQTLPKACARCGVETSRTSPFKFQGAHTNSSPYDWKQVHPLLFIFVAWRFGVQLLMTKIWESIEKRVNRHKASANSVTFKIPHCKDCSKNNPIVQRHFDFHGRRMIIEVHPDFRCGLKEKTQA